MDKISAAFITSIAILVMISGLIVYGTWVSDEKSQIEAQTIVENANTEDELVFNDDTSIKNNSDRMLWLRVKLVYNSKYDASRYMIVSGAINQGRWQSDSENWYYYIEPIGYDQTTEPLVDKLLYDGKEVSSNGSGRFSLQVEAVDEEWFVSKPDDGMEAFKVFKETMAIPDKTYL